MSEAPRRRAARGGAAYPYPLPLAPVNPLTGAAWAIDDGALRRLLAHCLAAPEFEARDEYGTDGFIAWVDADYARYLEAVRRPEPPLRTLERIERSAGELAGLLDRVAWGELALPWGGPVDGALDRAAREAAGRVSPSAPLPVGPLHFIGGRPDPSTVLDPRQMMVQAAYLAAGARAVREQLQRATTRRRGERDRGKLWARQLLIEGLWREYPAALRDLRLRGHFVETLRLLFRRGDDKRRAVREEARRALAAVATFRAAHQIEP